MADDTELQVANARVAELERENAELRERTDELEQKLYAKIEARAAAAPPATPASSVRPVPTVVAVAGMLLGVSGVFAANVTAMTAGLAMLIAGVVWGRRSS